jgi:hypothetical protein
MKLGAQGLLVALLALPYAHSLQESRCTGNVTNSIHDHTFTTIDGAKSISLSEYKGKILLVINTATF